MSQSSRHLNGTEPYAAGPDRRADRRETNFKALYRRLEHALDQIEQMGNVSGMLSHVLEILVREFRAELGFESGRLYERDGDDFVLCCGHGLQPGAPLGLRINSDEYLPQRNLLAEGLIVVRPGDPGYDPEFERSVGVSATFAAITLGEGNTHVMSFSIRGIPVDDMRIVYSLSTVRHVINVKLQQQKMSGVLEEARRIQQSLLPAASPEFPGYDIHGVSRPADAVGGDLFDYLPIASRLLGVAIADASGHGLPAALVARDVITGLRTALTEDLKVIRTVERLNRVIHRAALSSKFISLFYGEFEPDGYLVYCNAGHNPPLLLHGRTFLELRAGGLVLGFDPTAHYQSGYIRLSPGDLLVMYTDGVVDAEDPRGAPFGVRRLRRAIRELGGAGARNVTAALLAALDLHTCGRPQHDDISLVVVRKT